MDDPFPTLLLIFLGLLTAAVSSGLLACFVASSWWQAKHLKPAQNLHERLLTYFSRYPLRLTLTLKITYYAALVLLAIGIFLSLKALISTWYWWAASMLLLIPITWLLLHSIGYVVRFFMQYRIDKVLKISAVPIYFVYLMFYPLVWLLLYLLGNKSGKQNGNFEKENAVKSVCLQPFIASFLSESNEKEYSRKRIYQNALELPALRVNDCMIPRTEIAASDKKNGLEGVRQAFIKTGYSKILIYENSIDNIVGYCHCTSLFRPSQHLNDILVSILAVPETMPVSDLLSLFAKEYQGIAVVLDEFGGTAGIICTEDIMSEIFGEIKDEHDDETLEEYILSHNTFLLNARLEVYYLNQKYNWQIPEGEYDTLGGYILSVHENIPKKGEIIEASPFRFQILSTSEARIKLVKMTVEE